MDLRDRPFWPPPGNYLEALIHHFKLYPRVRMPAPDLRPAEGPVRREQMLHRVRRNQPPAVFVRTPPVSPTCKPMSHMMRVRPMPDAIAIKHPVPATSWPGEARHRVGDPATTNGRPRATFRLRFEYQGKRRCWCGLRPLLFTLVRESGAQILNWLITANHIVVSYFGSSSTQMDVFDSYGTRLGEIPCEQNQTNRLLTADPCGDEEVLFERESFMRPAEVYRYDVSSGAENLWAKRQGFSSITCACSRVTLRAKDGTQIPMSILGRRDLISGVPSPVIMTSYGGFGFSMIPQFSVLVTCLVESGCLFALPNIRGGSEFGAEWHNAAKHRNRQVAFDDFLSAATWLVDEARTTPSQLAIFGGSNSGLLVAAAMTQRPDLFRAVLCMVPITDMLRYHLFDSAHVWKDEFGTAQDSEDFAVLREYSPYHRIRDNVAYPATLLVSGDADQTCNSLHARKMTARLQAANRSAYPILLDYDAHRGHVPVLPLGKRIDALTDRLAFLSEQLQVAI